MAVVFTYQLPQDRPLYIFNNNIVRFKSDSSASPSISARISSGSFSITITPNLNGVFEYDFKEFFKSVLTNNFRDGFYEGKIAQGEPEEVGDSKQDFYSFIEKDFDFEITKDNGSRESTSVSYKLLRAVLPLDKYRSGLTNYNNNSIAFLLPLTDNASNVWYATYWDGYPFDLPIYSGVARTITVKNKTTNSEYDVDLTRGVNRLIVSSGITNLNLENILPIVLGENEIEITVSGLGGSITITLYLTKKEACTGHYLKWLNDEGGWCHFLCNEAFQERDAKQIGSFSKDFNNINQTKEHINSTGVNKEDSIRLFTGNISLQEKRLLNTLWGSPKIYRYLNIPFAEATADDWITESVLTSKIELENRIQKNYEPIFEISRSNPYQMKM